MRRAISSKQQIKWATGIFFALVSCTFAAGLFNDGADARSIAVGGTDSAQTGSALAAMNSNPAALTAISGFQLEANIGATFVDADFRRDGGERANAQEWAAYLPGVALALPAPRNFPIKFGLAFLPDVVAQIDWRYLDAPGGLGGATTYGEQEHRSRIFALRSNLAVAAELTHWFSIGASAGAIYTQNQLQAPYVFQSQPVLRGFKTLLDLDVDGVAPGFNLGAQFRPNPQLTIGLGYRFATVLHSDGSAFGNASAQLQSLGGGFAQVDPTFRYDASVRTKLPQIVTTGFEWQSLPRLRVIGGIDWIDWSDAFDRLMIDLSRGSNPAINSVVGADFMTDIAPLRWRDQYVYRAGLEFTATPHFLLRGGYSCARSAVPSDTLTPLTATIFKHKISLGAGYRSGRYHSDLAYLWALPTRQRVDRSALLDGEYSGTSVRVTQHSLEWSAGVDF